MNTKELIEQLQKLALFHSEEDGNILPNQTINGIAANRLAELEQQNRELVAQLERISFAHIASTDGSINKTVNWHMIGRILNETPQQSLQLLTEQEREKVAYDAFMVALTTDIQPGQEQQAAQQYAKQKHDE